MPHEARLELARERHAGGGPPPIAALVELAELHAPTRPEQAEALYLEALRHAKEGGEGAEED